MKIKVIINSRIGKSRIGNIETTVVRRFHGHQLDFSCTCHHGHAFSLAEKAAADKYDIVIAVGGDGTVNEVVNGIRGSNLSLGIIPAGTANDLAGYYHIPQDIDSACDVILNGQKHRTDVISVNGWHYLTAGGIGFPSDIIAAANNIRKHWLWRKVFSRLLGTKLYILALLSFLCRKGHCHGNQISLRDNDRCVDRNLLSLVVSNQPLLGRIFNVAPGAVNDDGLFDLALYERVDNMRQLLGVLVNIRRNGTERHAPIRTVRSAGITINTVAPLVYFGDGELSPPATHFEIHIIPAAANLIIPPAEVRSNAA